MKETSKWHISPHLEFLLGLLICFSSVSGNNETAIVSNNNETAIVGNNNETVTGPSGQPSHVSYNLDEILSKTRFSMDPNSMIDIIIEPKYGYTNQKTTVYCVAKEELNCTYLIFNGMPSHSYISYSSSSLTVMIINPNVSMSGVQPCSCNGETNQTKHVYAKHFSIREPLKEVKNIRCVSHNFKDLFLYWQDPNLKIGHETAGNWNVSFSVEHRPMDVHTPCVNIVNHNDYGTLNCSLLYGSKLTLQMHNLYAFELTYSDMRGTKSSYSACHMDAAIVQIDPIHELSVEPISPVSAIVRWMPNFVPSIRLFFSDSIVGESITYSLTVELDGEVKQQHNIVSKNRIQNFTLTGLLPMTEYNVSVKNKATTSPYWSDTVTVALRTPEDIPHVAPQIHPAGFQFTNGSCKHSPYLQPVLIYWKEVPVKPFHGNGVIEKYSVMTPGDQEVNQKPSILHLKLCVSTVVSSVLKIQAYTEVGASKVANYLVVPPLNKDLVVPACQVKAFADNKGIVLQWPITPGLKYTAFWCTADDNNCIDELQWADVPEGESEFYIKPTGLLRRTRVGLGAVNETTNVTMGITWADCVYSLKAVELSPVTLSITIREQTASVDVHTPCSYNIEEPQATNLIYCQKESSCQTVACCEEGTTVRQPVTKCQKHYNLDLPKPGTSYLFWTENVYRSNRTIVSEKYSESTPRDTVFPPEAWGGVAAVAVVIVILVCIVCRYKLKPSLKIKKIRVPGQVLDDNLKYHGSQMGDSSLSLENAKDTQYSYIWNGSLDRDSLPKKGANVIQTSRDSGIPDVEGFLSKGPPGKQAKHSYVNNHSDIESSSLPCSSSSSSLIGSVDPNTDPRSYLHKGTPPPHYQQCCTDEGYHGHGTSCHAKDSKDIFHFDSDFAVKKKSKCDAKPRSTCFSGSTSQEEEECRGDNSSTSEVDSYIKYAGSATAESDNDSLCGANRFSLGHIEGFDTNSGTDEITNIDDFLNAPRFPTHSDEFAMHLDESSQEPLLETRDSSGDTIQPLADSDYKVVTFMH